MSPDVNRRELLASTSLAASLGLAGCTRVLDWDANGRPCDEPELAATSSKPANLITVEGLVEAFGAAPVARFHDAGIDDPEEDDRYPAYLDRVDESTGELVVPVHPTDHMDGGAIEVTLESEDGAVTCSGLELEVEPLDPAPGAMEDAVDDLETALDDLIEQFGYAADQLRTSDSGSLSPLASGLAIAARTIEAPDNPQSIRAAVSGDADGGPDGETVALADAVAAESGLTTAVKDVAAGIASVDVPPLETPLGRARSTPAVSGVRSVSSSGNTPGGNDVVFGPGGFDAGDIGTFDASDIGAFDADDPGTFDADDPEPVDSPAIETVADLDRWMSLQAEFAAMDAGAAAAARKSGAIVVAGAAFVPGAQTASAAAGASLAVTELIISLGKDQLPAELELEATGEPGHTTHHELEDAPTEAGELVATVEGHSEGFTFSLPDAVGALPFGKLADGLGSMTRRGGEHVEDIVDYWQEALTSAADEQEENVDLIEFPPGLYGPVEVGPDDVGEYFVVTEEVHWTETGTDPYAFSPGDLTYEPQAVGAMEVKITSTDDAFGTAIDHDEVALEVDAIEMEIREGADGDRPRTEFRLDPAEDDMTLTLWAAVDNAEDTGVEWEWEPIVGSVPAGTPDLTPGPDTQSVLFDATGLDLDDWDGEEVVYRVTATSTAEGGVREDGEPERWAGANVKITDERPELELSSVPCVPLEATHAFAAHLGNERLPFEQVDAQVAGPGGIDAEGVYHPSAEGNVTVEIAYTTDDGTQLTDSESFEVSEHCSYIALASPYTGGMETCVGYELPDEDEIEDPDTTADIRIFPGESIAINGPRIRLDYEHSIHDEGEWEKEAPAYYPRDLWWGLQFSIHAPAVETYHPGFGNTMTVQRREREIDGETVPVFSGHFSGTVYDFSPCRGEKCQFPIELSFAGVLPWDHLDC